MATSYPTSIDSYTTKADNVDTVQAAHINNLQDAMVAVQTVLAAGSVARTAWTPGVGGETTNPTVAFSARGGFYARLGNIVFLAGYFTLSSASGGSGGLVITGLPFTVGNGANYRGIVMPGYAAGFTSLAPRSLLPLQNSQTIQMYGYGGSDARGDVGTQLTTANLSSATTLYFGGFYFV